MQRLTREHKLQDLPLFVALGKIQNHWHIRQVGVLLQAELHEDIDLALIEPMASLGHDPRPRPAAAAFDLAAFNGKI